MANYYSNLLNTKLDDFMITKIIDNTHLTLKCGQCNEEKDYHNQIISKINMGLFNNCGCQAKNKKRPNLTGQIINGYEVGHKEGTFYEVTCCECKEKKMISDSLLHKKTIAVCDCIKHLSAKKYDGEVYGAFTIIGEPFLRSENCRYKFVKIRCDKCHQEHVRYLNSVNNKPTHCGCLTTILGRKELDYILNKRIRGLDRIGHLTVIESLNVKSKRRTFNSYNGSIVYLKSWVVKCDCGNTRTYTEPYLLAKNHPICCGQINCSFKKKNERITEISNVEM